MLENIKINPEFERLIPPLLDEEFELLKSNIISEGEIYTPIFIWDGQIIDGHHRYKILSENRDIKFKVIEKEFDNQYEAMSWICNNQLGRRNLTPENKKYLIGKRYEAEKKAIGALDGFRGNQYKKVVGYQNDNLPKNTKRSKTCDKVAAESGTSNIYVIRAGDFAKGVDAAEEAVPGIKKEILSGKIKRPAKEIAEIAKAPQEQRRALTENLRLTKVYDKKPANFNQNVKSIAIEMRNLDTPVSDESVLETLQGTVRMFIESCESTFINHPNILLNEENCQKALVILEKAKEYVNNLKEINDNAKYK